MADTGVKYAVSCTETSTGISWSNLSNGAGSNDSDATTVVLFDGEESKSIIFSNFSCNLPTDSTVNGIKVEVRESCSNQSRATGSWTNIRLMLDGIEVGNDKAGVSTDVNSVKTTVVYGGISDLWGTTPTYTQINNSNFGITLKAIDLDALGQTATISLYWLRVTIYYTDNSNTVKKHTMFFTC